jgi:putative flippase GtrA
LIEELTRFARFGAVGVVNTLLTLVTFELLNRIGVPVTAASAAGFAVGAANGYALNRAWTFRAPGSLMRYVGVQAVGAACSAAGVAIALAALVTQRLEAEALIIAPVTMITYTLARRLVFQSSPPAAGTPSTSAVTSSVPCRSRPYESPAPEATPTPASTAMQAA